MTEGFPGLWRFSADLSGSNSAQRLNQALAWLTEQQLLPFVPVQKSVNIHGKPFFADLPALHFSLSHCQSEWVCLIASAPVGIDIEQIRGCRQEAIARRFFHPAGTSLADAASTSLLPDLDGKGKRRQMVGNRYRGRLFPLQRGRRNRPAVRDAGLPADSVCHKKRNARHDVPGALP